MGIVGKLSITSQVITMVVDTIFTIPIDMLICLGMSGVDFKVQTAVAGVGFQYNIIFRAKIK